MDDRVAELKTNVRDSLVSSQGGISEEQAEEPEEHVNEKRVLRKIDLHVLVPLWLMFLAAFMDRTNLGNVRLLGMEKDLQLQSDTYNIALQVFFVTYVVFDVPINMLLKRTRPSWLFSAMALLWGISSMCQGFTRNYRQLVACRLFLGVFEAGFVPGAIYLMSVYYKRHELMVRFNLFFTAGVIAGAVSGLLAYAVVKMEGIGGLAGWRWVLIIEGLLACALAAFALCTLADWPAQATFLTSSEKAFWQARTASDCGTAATMDRLTRTSFLRIIKDWKVWCGALMYMSVGVSGYSSALWIPSIISSLGYSGIESQVQSIPVWVVAAVACFTSGLLSDKLRHRYGILMCGICLSIVGYAILIAQGPLPTSTAPRAGLPVSVRYMATFFVVTGTFVVQSAVVVWLSNNLSGDYKKSIGSAIQISFGNFAGIISSNIFPARDAPRYFTGYGVVVAMLLFAALLATAFATGLTLENKKRDRGERDYRLRLPEGELTNLGDDHPDFRFSV